MLMATLVFITNQSSSPDLPLPRRSAHGSGNGGASANRSTALKALGRGIADKFERYESWVFRIL